MAFEKSGAIQAPGKDRNSRTIADGVEAGCWVTLEMIRAGFAWRYVKYSSDGRLIDAEAAARGARRGLWVDPAPVAPWEWRKQ